MAVRIANRINRYLFGKRRAAHWKCPQRLVALICQHDAGTRRHMHMLFALPTHVTMASFTDALRDALQHEAFAFRNGVDDLRSCVIERVSNLRKSVFYNIDARKSLSDDPILYNYPDKRRIQEKTDERTTQSADLDRDAQRPTAA